MKKWRLIVITHQGTSRQIQDNAQHTVNYDSISVKNIL